MSYNGHVVNGNIVLDETTDLPEGVAVRIEILGCGADKTLHPDIVRFTGVLPSDVDARSDYMESMRKKHA